jgi:predicted nucleic acid-binding protein
VIVVDASVLSVGLADDGEDGDTVRQHLEGEVLAAPEIVDLEIVSVVRKLVTRGELPVRRATLALADLVALPLTRAPHRPLLDRCWALRDNLTPYDAAYVALAELLGCPLVTADARLSRAPGLACPVEVLTSGNS